jgi:hypothetical protein
MELMQTRLVRTLLVATLIGAAGVMPSAALGQCVGQAGSSALEQYCEAVPRGDGGRDTTTNSGSASGSSSGSGSSLPADTASTLAESKDGSKLAALAENSGGDAPSGSKTSDESAVKGTQVSGPAAPDGSPLQAATKAAGSGPIAGQAVTWSLVGLTALGALGALWLRRRPVDGE